MECHGSYFLHTFYQLPPGDLAGYRRPVCPLSAQSPGPEGLNAVPFITPKDSGRPGGLIFNRPRSIKKCARELFDSSCLLAPQVITVILSTLVRAVVLSAAGEFKLKQAKVVVYTSFLGFCFRPGSRSNQTAQVGPWDHIEVDDQEEEGKFEMSITFQTYPSNYTTTIANEKGRRKCRAEPGALETRSNFTPRACNLGLNLPVGSSQARVQVVWHGWKDTWAHLPAVWLTGEICPKNHEHKKYIFSKMSCCFNFNFFGRYSNLQIFKSSNLQIFKSSNLQIFKSSNLQIFKSSNLQIFKSSNLQIFKSSNLQIFKSSNLQIFKSLNLQIFKSSNLQIFKSSNLQIFKSSNLQIFKSSNLQIFKSSNLQIFKSSNLQIFKSSNLQIFKSSNLQIFKSSNLQIFKSSNLQIFKSSNLQIFKSSNLQIFKSSNLQIFKSSNLQIFKSSNLKQNSLLVHTFKSKKKIL
ncbi:conserved hypothetical protein [Culex quinquefasciatus]|uniref:Uncharacterized protein n=1 Tax=Culex quinquefasciatus TaxID=7176 RepID=B0WNJ1_CULQU|nr:conserved hypothetical protein [Culex quinquefasciatus]|eukprot:XP_001850275.1 conserved hypothetical protein [Culex quinquefasciatus]